jgi:hypothetical protein
MKDTNVKVQIPHAKTIGSYFLLVFLAYGFGRHFFESENVIEKYLGCVLIITNSIMVLLIGFLLRKSIQNYNQLVGNIYLLTRIFEAIVLASIVLNLVPTISISYQYPYFIAMLVLGLGSIPMCLTFYRHKILPTWLEQFENFISDDFDTFNVQPGEECVYYSESTYPLYEIEKNK